MTLTSIASPRPLLPRLEKATAERSSPCECEFCLFMQTTAPERMRLMNVSAALECFEAEDLAPPPVAEHDPWAAARERLRANPWAVCRWCWSAAGSSGDYVEISRRREEFLAGSEAA